MPQFIGGVKNASNKQVLLVVMEPGQQTVEILEKVWLGKTLNNKINAINKDLRKAGLPADIKSVARNGQLVVVTGDAHLGDIG